MARPSTPGGWTVSVDGDPGELLEDVDDASVPAPPPAPAAPSGEPAPLPPPPGLPPAPGGSRLDAVSREARVGPEPAASSRLAARSPAADVLTAVQRAGSAKARLAALAPAEGVALTAEDVVAIVRAMPDGWQRRTAARRLLTRSAVIDVDAEALVASLARRGDRNAVASLLVDAGQAHVETVADRLDARTADRLRRRAARDA